MSKRKLKERRELIYNIWTVPWTCLHPNSHYKCPKTQMLKVTFASNGTAFEAGLLLVCGNTKKPDDGLAGHFYGLTTHLITIQDEGLRADYCLRYDVNDIVFYVSPWGSRMFGFWKTTGSIIEYNLLQLGIHQCPECISPNTNI